MTGRTDADSDAFEAYAREHFPGGVRRVGVYQLRLAFYAGAAFARSTTQASASSEERSGVGVVEALEIMKAAHSETQRGDTAKYGWTGEDCAADCKISSEEERCVDCPLLRSNGGSAKEGWKLVPMEPTREMYLAGVAAEETPKQIYRAMLAAAPSPDGKEEKR